MITKVKYVGQESTIKEPFPYYKVLHFFEDEQGSTYIVDGEICCWGHIDTVSFLDPENFAQWFGWREIDFSMFEAPELDWLKSQYEDDREDGSLCLV